jgi:multidrug efflux pump subunit AcrA (membrane-fusion protein)
MKTSISLWVCSATVVLAALPAGGQISVDSQRAILPHCKVSLIDEAEVPAREAGVLVSLNARRGMTVEAGSLLAQIDDLQAQMAKKVAQLEYDVSRKEAENDISVRAAQAASLVAKAEYDEAIEANRRVSGTVTPSEVRRLLLTYNRSRLQIELAQLEFSIVRLNTRTRAAQVEAAENAIQRRRIEAPLSGVIAEVHRHAGEWVNAGDPVLRVVRMDKLRVEGYVDAPQLAPQEVLQRPVTVVVRLAHGQEERVNSTVGFVSPLVEATGQYRISADINNTATGAHWLISPGMMAEMTIDLAAP